jgi:hypothetical protein
MSSNIMAAGSILSMVITSRGGFQTRPYSG